MARCGSFLATLNGVRYVLFALGVLLLIGEKCGDNPQPSSGLTAFAVACLFIGFPFQLIVRFVAWLLRLFGIGKRKSAPVSQVRITVEWGDDPATDKQLGFIRHLGGNPPKGLTKGAASEMIESLLAEKRGRA